MTPAKMEKKIEKFIDSLAQACEDDDANYLEALNELSERATNAYNAHQEFLESKEEGK